ncbi:ABC1 kinase family protein [Calorimonas adulescens]|uniref:AarF/ABC1/UbiB kinase family protein n=1 Tax=Calorimonas adulescens TaxID=2606906 RepID=A0A5D8QG57_9THEO|nr:AarF/UbiB family protein [Calorimonas adulescens]TZE83134.1 AarF/ABC1/UbiB kinase family protein [Calorimonas adulescens]
MRRRFYRIIHLFLYIIWKLQLAQWKGWFKDNAYSDNLLALLKNLSKRYKDTAIDMGGLLIKLGQFFSARIDILPDEVIQELAQLQDRVPPVDYKSIKTIIENEFEKPIDEVYIYFSKETIGSASLAQVHMAKLSDGKDVAVKVLRPGIEDIISTDLKALRRVIDIMKHIKWISRDIDLDGLYMEFYQTLKNEMDYKAELSNAETIKNNLKGFTDFYIPRYYHEYCTRRVLTMEFIDGIKITDEEGLAHIGADKKKITRILIDSFFHQIIEDGFFHADPHPGNIFALKDGRVALIDFGMVGSITPKNMRNIRRMVLSIVFREVEQLVDALDEMGFIKPNADEKRLTASLEYMIDKFWSRTTLSDLDEEFLRGMAQESQQLIFEQPIQLPSDFAFLGKTFITLFGICAALDKDLDYGKLTKEFAQRIIKSEVTRLPSELIRISRKFITDIIELPNIVDSGLAMIKDGNFRVISKIPDMERLIELEKDRSTRLMFSIYTCGMGILSTYLFLSDYKAIGILGFVTTVILFIRSLT